MTSTSGIAQRSTSPMQRYSRETEESRRERIYLNTWNLHEAFILRNAKLMEEYGGTEVDINYLNGDKDNLIHCGAKYASEVKGGPKVLERLMRIFPEQANEYNHEGKTPFLLAIEHKQFDNVSFMVTDFKINIHKPDKYGKDLEDYARKFYDPDIYGLIKSVLELRPKPVEEKSEATNKPVEEKQETTQKPAKKKPLAEFKLKYDTKKKGVKKGDSGSKSVIDVSYYERFGITISTL